MRSQYSEKCDPHECLHCEIGILGTKYCMWCSEECPSTGCYLEEAKEKGFEENNEFFFML